MNGVNEVRMRALSANWISRPFPVLSGFQTVMAGVERLAVHDHENGACALGFDFIPGRCLRCIAAACNMPPYNPATPQGAFFVSQKNRRAFHEILAKKRLLPQSRRDAEKNENPLKKYGLPPFRPVLEMSMGRTESNKALFLDD